MPAYSRILLPWDSQPQEAAEPDLSNPLADKLSDILLPYQRRTWRGQAASLVGTVTDGYGKDGKNRTFAAGTNSDTYSGPWAGKSSTFSVLCLYYVNTVPAGTARVVSNFASTFSGWTIAPSNTNFRGIVAHGAGNVVLTGSAVAAGRKIDVLTSTGTASWYYENGALSASNTSHAAVVANADAVYVGSDWGGAAATPSSVYLVAIWDRVLTAREVAELYVNPWQLFAPRSIWVPVSTTAGTSYTITPSGGITFAGSGLDLRTKVISPTGGVTFAGTGSITFAGGGTEYIITPSGGISFAGTGTQVQSKTITPTGGFTFSGAGTEVHGKVVVPSGGITFGGTGSMSSNTTPASALAGERTKVGVGT